jgi:uncharacterized membrane protein (UPF0127 family)
LLLLATGGANAAEPAFLLEGFRQVQGVLESRAGCQSLDLWLAQTPEQRAQGLMYIRELGEYEGMLFPSEQPALLSMWMRNTYVSLDMLFIGADGRVSSIAASTTPLSEQSIRSQEPVLAVLELNAGYAARHRVARGDRLMLFQ